MAHRTTEKEDSPTKVTAINPATEEFLETFTYATPDERAQRLEKARLGFDHWRATTPAQRAQHLQSMAVTLRGQGRHYAQCITATMGKRYVEALAEIEKCATLCEWYAEHGPAMLDDEALPVSEATAYVSYLPLGAVLGIMPWNFPFWQVMRAAVPILLAGNVFLLKHAQNVWRCAYALEEAWRDAGLPDGVFQMLAVPSANVAEIIADDRIAAVTLTGSGKAGASVAQQAGAACKKTVLELGGSDPFIVLADADINRAVKAGIESRFANAGQVCIAAKRFILEAPIAETFMKKFVHAAQELVAGDPMDDATTLAPLARADLRDALHAQVQNTIRQGAQLLCGGYPLERPGFFYAPTVLAGVQPGMAAFEEETFGPVTAMTVVKDRNEAVMLANRHAYGLSGNLWTEDETTARALARRLETGAVFINGFSKSDPRTPIGGVKQSGYGRELSYFGVREFTNAQTVWINP